MSDRKHTPEPWRLSGPDDFGDYTIQGPEDELAIAAVTNGEMRRMGGRSDEHAKNAALLFAAPKILKILKEAEAMFRWYGDLHAAKPDHDKAERNYEMADKCAAVIAQAEGRES